MISLNGTKCCGVLEIDDLSTCSTPEKALIGIAQALRTGYTHRWGFVDESGDMKYNFPVPFVTFTGVVKRKINDHASGRKDNYGQAFADYLESNELGLVLDSYERKNWTGNTIKLWIWHPDYDKLLPFLANLEA
jgi:hypothetical protein